MAEKFTQDKNIRKALEKLNADKLSQHSIQSKLKKKYQGLGLNWRDIVILILALFFVGLYQVQAHAQNIVNLDEIDTSVMLSYNPQSDNYTVLSTKVCLVELILPRMCIST